MNLEKIKNYLGSSDFQTLFVEELGWSNPTEKRGVAVSVGGADCLRRQIAQLAGVVVFEIAAPDGKIPDSKTRRQIGDELTKTFHENLLIFVDGEREQSLWFWAKREGAKTFPREHLYTRGQPADLMLSKIVGLHFDISEFDLDGDISVVNVAKKLKDTLDVERVTRKFYGDFEKQHAAFLEHIAGIADERERRWYASVLLNRLMFVYFLQRKGFLFVGRAANPSADVDYLKQKLAAGQQKGANLFYREFLQKLFFVGFAKPDDDAEKLAARNLLGEIPYLNGGLFLPHQIETNNLDIEIADAAFESLFDLFARYNWNLDDSPEGKPDEINPDVLGYIFEKYINQKAFGAYYTRPEITNYLCEQTIYKLILERVNSLAMPAHPKTESLFGTERETLFNTRRYDSMPDLLMNLDAFLCRKMFFEWLPDLKLLDPACGSGAFLVAAMKTLINVYSAIIGRIEFLGDENLKQDIKTLRDNHHDSLNYFIKREIIINNLFGVDIMEEATEIAKLRLFLALVASAKRRDQLEPLPNIDFNILAGNSLIGILKVNAEKFDKDVQPNFLAGETAATYGKILAHKNETIRLYKKHSDIKGNSHGVDKNVRLLQLRDDAQKVRRESQIKLNEILLGDFKDHKINFEQATWDAAKNKEGKSEKRPLAVSDIEDLRPFHWGFEFDEVLNKNGGFDAIITNPPWEVFQTDEKEFFENHLKTIPENKLKIQKNKLRIEEWKIHQAELMKNEIVCQTWLQYASGFPFVSKFFKTSSQYKNQISIINGRNAGSKINLYSYFLEQCFNLLRAGGECGIVIPSGIYTDLGTKQLREMLFNESEITGLFCFENRKMIFEEVDSRFKFVVLTFQKGGRTEKFPTAFMRHDVRELERFPRVGALPISVELIRRVSPDSLSVMEFKNETDVRIAEKMLRFPLLGERIENKWNLRLSNEFNMTTDSHLFQTSNGAGRLPLYEGKIIHQFTNKLSQPRYWIDENTAKTVLMISRKREIKILAKRFELRWDEDEKILLDYDSYRLAFRDVARNTDERTAISTILPPKVFCPHTMSLETVNVVHIENETILPNFQTMDNRSRLFMCALLNSFVIDSWLRLSVTAHLSFFFIYTLPVPRLTEADAEFVPIVERAAKLICTAPEFDDLAREVGLGSHKNGVTDIAERQTLRAELAAHLYGLTEPEFAYILTTFPLVAQTTKDAALQKFREFAPHPDDAQLLQLIPAGETKRLEFKVAAAWNDHTKTKDDKMRDKILQAVAAFLNDREGGAVLIGVDSANNIIGLAEDFIAVNSKQPGRDSYERFLRDIFNHNFGTQLSGFCEISFHLLANKEMCRINVKPAPEPVYLNNELYVRDGNGKRKLSTAEAVPFIKHRWDK